ncbi:MAG: xanthine dehydrogenase family protein subunit M [Deltaproteobacteria bacterium]|nr:xanthine dehydrogenase family protein subunit M [Deltaproteobacteria bacterium]
MSRLRPFDYFEPATLQEAIQILAKHGEDARPLAGGTDLLVQMRDRKREPKVLVYLHKLQELKAFGEDGKGNFRMGALTPIRVFETDPRMKERFPVLYDGAVQFAAVQMRNMGTIGGNLCNAVPSAEMAPPFLVLDTKAVIVGPDGEKVIPLEQLFAGPSKNSLKPTELLKEVLVPLPGPRSAGCYIKLSPRRAMDIAIVGIAANVAMEGKDGVCKDVAIALGAVSPTPKRARRAEALLRGRRLADDLIEQAAQLSAEESSPITDIRGSAEYRREMVKVLTRRAIKRSLERIG